MFVLAKNAVPVWEMGRSVTGEAALIATALYKCFSRFDFFFDKFVRVFFFVHQPTQEGTFNS